MRNAFWVTLMSVIYPSFTVQVENNPNSNSEDLINVFVEIIQSVRHSEVLCYTFTRKELIEEEENAIKEDLFYAMVMAGMDIPDADVIISDIVMAATNSICAEVYNKSDNLTISLSVIANFRSEDGVSYLPQMHDDTADSVEDKPKPATKEMVDALETIIYEDDEDNIEECTICMKKFLSGSELHILGCGHKFGKSCISKWLCQNNSCPLCRFKLQ